MLVYVKGPIVCAALSAVSLMLGVWQIACVYALFALLFVFYSCIFNLPLLLGKHSAVNSYIKSHINQKGEESVAKVDDALKFMILDDSLLGAYNVHKSDKDAEFNDLLWRRLIKLQYDVSA